MADQTGSPSSLRPTDVRGAGPALLTLVLILALPVLYVLSIGPAAMLQRHDILPEGIRYFYAPVIWLHDNTVLQRPLEDYVAWWES